MTSRKALNKIKLNRVYDIVEEAIQNELKWYLFLIDCEMLDAIKIGILRRVKKELENEK